MALVSSGAVSIEQIAMELGWVSSDPFYNTWDDSSWSLGESAVRAYLGKSGVISLYDAYRATSPVKVTVSSIVATTNSITFNWTAPAGESISAYWVSESGLSIKPSSKGTSLSYTISKIAPGTKKVIYVFPEVAGKQAELITITGYSWLLDVTGLTAIQSYTGNGTTDTWSLDYSWNAVTDATGYYYSIDGGATWVHTNITSFTRTGLSINKATNFRVYAMNVFGSASQYNTPIDWTIIYEAPTGLTHSNVGILDAAWRYVTMSWTNIAAKPGWYWLEVNGITTPTDVWTSWFSEATGTTTSVTNWTFRRGQQYKFRVYAADVNYSGYWSYWYTFNVTA